jgi:hypothetical protein
MIWHELRPGTHIPKNLYIRHLDDTVPEPSVNTSPLKDSLLAQGCRQCHPPDTQKRLDCAHATTTPYPRSADTAMNIDDMGHIYNKDDRCIRCHTSKAGSHSAAVGSCKAGVVVHPTNKVQAGWWGTVHYVCWTNPGRHSKNEPCEPCTRDRDKALGVGHGHVPGSDPDPHSTYPKK